MLRLPIDPYLPRIADVVRRERAVVVVAPPGAGKTTRLPPVLARDGPTIVLQPRRIAARSLARRIAEERGWQVGREVGWHVRFERRFTPRTRIVIATEGVLTARLRADPLLEAFRTVVIDEFHERSLHADLALAFARQAALARDDLRLVVTSATLDAEAVAGFLGGCEIVRVDARPHPVVVRHEPGVAMEAAAYREWRNGSGSLLCFEPGAAEIRRTCRALESRIGPGWVFPLHGGLSADAQDAAIAPREDRRIVVATNLAETSLTVEGVSTVVDSGLQRVPRYVPELALDRLETERVAADSAAQRAGRAGRTGPGTAIRLWDPRDTLAPTREAEILRVDLAGPLLAVLDWGADPRTFAWFDAPPQSALDAAFELLGRLGAVRDGRISQLGRRLARLPLPPRLGRLLIEAGPDPRAAAACAVLGEGWRPRDEPDATRSDVLSAADRVARAPERVRRAARQLGRLARGATEADREPGTAEHDAADARLLRAVLAAYPDRVARRREPGSPRLLLASGHGARLSDRSGVREGELLVAVSLRAGRRGPNSEAVVDMASVVERGWLAADRSEVEHELDANSQTVRALERHYLGRVMLEAKPVDADPEVAARLLAAAWRERPMDAEDGALLRRLRFANLEIDFDARVSAACHGETRLPDLRLPRLLSHAELERLERLAPARLTVPSGRHVRIEYRDDGTLRAAVKLQELFGLAETPRVGARGTPVTLELLAPNGRPVQTTSDLRSFWNETYATVRRELRGRYPKHPWPEDPWTATPTARTKGRRSGR